MAYVGQKPATTLTMPTSQYFSGDGSTTTFTLNKSVTVGEELEVFVNNIQQEPGSGKSYTATGTTLTFDAAPSSGTDNVYVVYRGLAQFNARLEHDANAALAATTGTFSGDLTVDTNTLYVDSTNNRVGIGTTSPQKQFAVSDAGGMGIELSPDDGGNGYSRILNYDRTGNAFEPLRIEAEDLRFHANGTERMRIDSSGRVTMPYQPFARASYSGGNLGATNIVPLNAYAVTRGGMTIASNRITVPVTGAYFVGFHHLSNSGGVQIRVLKNGVTQGGSYTQELDGNNINFSAQQIIECSANDYLEFQTFSAGLVHGNADYNSMWAFLLG